MKDTLIKRFAWVTCEDGHRICRAKADILGTDLVRVDAFEWSIPKPKTGEAFTPHECGKYYIRQTASGGIEAHLEDSGWTGNRPRWM